VKEGIWRTLGTSQRWSEGGTEGVRGRHAHVASGVQDKRRRAVGAVAGRHLVLSAVEDVEFYATVLLRIVIVGFFACLTLAIRIRFAVWNQKGFTLFC
jgi:hypothetical protein